MSSKIPRFLEAPKRRFVVIVKALREGRGRKRLTAFLFLFFHLMGFGSSIDAVMSTRTSQGAIAWAVSLNTFPYVAVPAYWIFGRSEFKGYIVARRATNIQSGREQRNMIETLDRYRIEEGERVEATRAANRLAGMPALRGHRADLLIDGEATFDSIFRGIEEAKEYVLVQFYIVRDDGLGQALKKRLLAKAAEGVRVYFLYDEVGSHGLSRDYIRELRDGGVEMHDFNSRKGPRNRLQINFRNHRKIVVTDGRVAWIGGHNVGDEYLGKDPDFGHWRDTHIRLEGPSVLNAQVSFIEDWYWATETLPELTWSGRPAEDGSNLSALIIPSGPVDEFETATLMFVHAINSAEERIWIATPYFVPDDSVMRALQLAGLRGVDVRILIPKKTDSLLIYLAAHSYFDEAIQTGVKLYRYQNGFLHQKVLLIDENVAAIGTANFDNRSFRLNFEITAFIAGLDFALQTEKMLEDDFAHSRLIEAGEYDRKPWWFQLGVHVARLTAPIL